MKCLDIPVFVNTASCQIGARGGSEVNHQWGNVKDVFFLKKDSNGIKQNGTHVQRFIKERRRIQFMGIRGDKEEYIIKEGTKRST